MITDRHPSRAAGGLRRTLRDRLGAPAYQWRRHFRGNDRKPAGISAFPHEKPANPPGTENAIPSAPRAEAPVAVTASERAFRGLTGRPRDVYRVRVILPSLLSGFAPHKRGIRLGAVTPALLGRRPA